WSAGLRHDRVKAGSVDGALAGTTVDNRGESPRRTSGMLEFRTSEFGRIRGQYNYDQSRTRPDHQIFMQYTISLGAHGAHGY
ncbi:MAG: hypothetical protein JNK11_04900, partial [Alphaproteobacteria bacterium]|nr:hypothetical protein [Alphaproteobacteria bacterium]